MTFSILYYTRTVGQKLSYLKTVLVTELNIQFSKLVKEKRSLIRKVLGSVLAIIFILSNLSGKNKNF